MVGRHVGGFQLGLGRPVSGGASADWIAADDVSPTPSPSDPGGVTAAFGAWYSTFSTYGRPLLISNTGTTPGAQGPFLAQLSTELPGSFPLIRGVVYDDAPDIATGAQLSLDPNGLAGFRTLSRTAYFQPVRSASSTSIRTTATQAAPGQPVTTTVSVNAPDLGGSVTFLVNGAAVIGCSYLPVTVTTGCTTSTLPVGTDSIVAAYTGDAAFSPSTSAPLSVVVTTAPVSTVPASPTPAVVLSSGPTRWSSVHGTRPVRCRPPPPPQGTTGRQPVVPGPCQAYLGASVNPTGSTLPEPADLAALDQGLARPASIVQVDQAWNTPINTTQLEQTYATGAIPMIAWSCGDLDSHVINGNDDATITAAAQAMASSGIPLLLQWYADPGSFPGDSSKCFGNAGASGYVQAYRYIVRLFRAAGADNVSFVWSVDTNDSPASTWNALYPGASFVDWIAADGFDRSTSPPTTGLVQNRFGAWYSTFSSFGKPLMISDTGALTGQDPSVQDTYLNLLASLLPTTFPLIKAVIYEDGREPGPTGAPYDFTLDPTGQSAFDALAASPYFQPDQLATSTSVSVSDPSPPEGKVVTITATVAGSDRGGSVSFSDNGTPIPGCDDVQVLNASSCETSSLPDGTNDITADYLGDAAYGPSDSTPVTVTVSSAAGEQGRPYIPPVGTAYLGAWVRPLPVTKQTPVNQELSTLPTFNGGLGRSLSVVHVYQNWASPTPAATLEKVLANGATPMIDWRCGPSDATILSGQDDALITGFATELAQLKAPVFLRWFYEFNFPNSPDYKACIAALGPAGYAAAFRHIHALFTAAGATNVSFVWCIASGGQDQDWIKYYPGPAYVDWIAVDGYLRNSTTYQAGQFAQLFGSWYSTFDSFGKPMMITETAALSGAQSPYLADLKQYLDSGYPMIRGVLYFDAPGQGGHLPLPLGRLGLLDVPVPGQRPALPAAPGVFGHLGDGVHPVGRTDRGRAHQRRRHLRLRRLGEPVQQRIPHHRLPADGRGHRPVVHHGEPPGRNRRADRRLQRRRRVREVDQRADPGAVGPLLRRHSLGIAAGPAGRRTGPPAQPPPHHVAWRVRPPGRDHAIDHTPNGLDLWGLILGRAGYGWAGILAGVALMIIGGFYMLVTWIKDEQLKRRWSRP